MRKGDGKRIEQPIPQPLSTITSSTAAKLEIPKDEPMVKPNEKGEFPSANDRCIWRNSPPANTTLEVSFFFIKYLGNRLFPNVQVRQLYDNLPFDDPKGGVWTQGFDIEYDPSQWTPNNKLKVILMPHSHCDPGTYIYIYIYSKVQKSLPSVFQLFISKEMMNKKIKYIQR